MADGETRTHSFSVVTPLRPIELGTGWELQFGRATVFGSFIEGPVVVTRNNAAVAVLLGVSDGDELERLLLVHSRKLGAILDAADRRIEEGAGIEHDEFWEQVQSASRGRANNGSRKKRRTAGRPRWSLLPER